MPGRGTENQNRQPPIGRIGGQVVHPFPDWLEAVKVVMLLEEFVQAGQLCALGQVHAHLLQELLLAFVR